jgi:hypothetical protein
MSRSLVTTVELTIHRCHLIRISRHYPNINNAIAFEILHEGGGTELLLFGLDKKTTHRLVSIFSDKDTTVDRDPIPQPTMRGDDVAAA